jgi:hypothetical protein
MGSLTYFSLCSKSNTTSLILLWLSLTYQAIQALSFDHNWLTFTLQNIHMSDFHFTSSINTDNISQKSFDLFLSMYEMIDELYDILYDSYGNPLHSEDEMNETLKKTDRNMRRELDMVVSTLNSKKLKNEI